MRSRAKKIKNLLERLLKQDHLYSDEKLKEIKEQLKVLKEKYFKNKIIRRIW